MALLYSTWPYITLLDLTLLYFGSSLHLSLHHLLCSTALSLALFLFYHSSTWFYITLLWLYFTVHDSTLFCHNSTLLYLTLLCFYFSLLDSTLIYIGCTSLYLLYKILQWLCFTLLDSTLVCYGSTSLYLSPHYPSMAVVHSTWLYSIP